MRYSYYSNKYNINKLSIHLNINILTSLHTSCTTVRGRNNTVHCIIKIVAATTYSTIGILVLFIPQVKYIGAILFYSLLPPQQPIKLLTPEPVPPNKVVIKPISFSSSPSLLSILAISISSGDAKSLVLYF